MASTWFWIWAYALDLVGDCNTSISIYPPLICRIILERSSCVVSMFPRIIFILVIYSLLVPMMWSDQICQSGKELVGLLFLITIFTCFLEVSICLTSYNLDAWFWLCQMQKLLFQVECQCLKSLQLWTHVCPSKEVDPTFVESFEILSYKFWLKFKILDAHVSLIFV